VSLDADPEGRWFCLAGVMEDGTALYCNGRAAEFKFLRFEGWHVVVPLCPVHGQLWSDPLAPPPIRPVEPTPPPGATT
jgi:hypothetical protein